MLLGKPEISSHVFQTPAMDIPRMYFPGAPTIVSIQFLGFPPSVRMRLAIPNKITISKTVSTVACPFCFRILLYLHILCSLFKTGLLLFCRTLRFHAASHSRHLCKIRDCSLYTARLHTGFLLPFVPRTFHTHRFCNHSTLHASPATAEGRHNCLLANITDCLFYSKPDNSATLIIKRQKREKSEGLFSLLF